MIGDLWSDPVAAHVHALDFCRHGAPLVAKGCAFCRALLENRNKVVEDK